MFMYTLRALTASLGALEILLYLFRILGRFVSFFCEWGRAQISPFNRDVADT